MSVTYRHSIFVLFTVLLCGWLSLVCNQQIVYAQSEQRQSNQKTGTAVAEVDLASANWAAKDKYILTVAATKTAGQDTALPYAKVDGNKVAAAFLAKGYKKLDTLTDNNATRENFVENLKRIRTLGENGLVVVYYSGHGAVDPQGRDLWLQLYGQKYFGDSQGLAVSELIKIARAGTYKGELVVILDACYSGQGAWTRSLNLSEVENTLIFASNSRTQAAFPVDVSPNETMSAFSFYLLKGLTDDWEIVDERQQGIVLYEDLRTYIEIKLTELLFKSNQLGIEMTPEISGQPGKIWAAFDSSKARNLQTLLRQAISFRNYFKSQLPNLLGQQQSLPPPTMPANALSLAQIVPATADSYTKALQAIAEGRSDDALRLLNDAEKNKSADLVDIYQARANAFMYQGRFEEGKDWYEKALKINKSDNPQLLEEASMAYAVASNLQRSEVLLRQAVQLRESKSLATVELVGDYLGLAALQFFQGRLAEAEVSLRRVQSFDPRLLDETEPGANLIPQMFMMLLKIMQDDFAEAEALAKEFRKKAEVLNVDDPIRVMGLFLLSVMYAGLDGKEEFVSLASEFLDAWERAVTNKNTESVTVYLGFVVGMSTGLTRLFGEKSPLATRFEMISQKSLELIRSLHGPNSPELALALNNVAIGYFSTEKYVEAEPVLLEAIRVFESTVGPNNIVAVTMYTSLGGIYRKLKKYPQAEEALKRSLKIADSAGPNSMFVMMPLEQLALVYEAQHQLDKAAALYERMLTITTSIWPSLPEMKVEAVGDLAEILKKQKKYSQAEKTYKQTLNAIERGANPESHDTVLVLLGLGSLYFEQERYKDAETAFSRAVSIEEKQKRPAIESLAQGFLGLSEIYTLQKQSAKADTASKRLSQIVAQLKTAADRDDVASVVMKLAGTYSQQQKDLDANRLYGLVLELYQDEASNIRSAVAVHLYAMGQFYQTRRNYQQAEALFKRAIVIDEEVFANDHLEVAIDLEALAEVYSETGHYEEAISLYLRANPIREKSGDPTAFAIGLRKLAFAYVQLHKYAEARVPLEKAIALWEKSTKPTDAEFSSCLSFLGVVYYETTQDFARAEALLNRAILVDEREGKVALKDLVDDLRLLANVYRFQKRFDDSKKALRRARDLIQTSLGKADYSVVQVLFNLALVYNAEGGDQQVRLTLQEALALTAQQPPATRSYLKSWLGHNAGALRFMKRTDEADLLDRWAKEIADGEGL